MSTKRRRPAVLNGGHRPWAGKGGRKKEEGGERKKKKKVRHLSIPQPRDLPPLGHGRKEEKEKGRGRGGGKGGYHPSSSLS